MAILTGRDDAEPEVDERCQHGNAPWLCRACAELDAAYEQAQMVASEEADAEREDGASARRDALEDAKAEQKQMDESGR